MRFSTRAKTKVPFFGICLGMQVALIEISRDVAKLKDADSTEFNQDAPYKIFVMLPELKGVVNMGGTMRLGAYVCDLTPESQLRVFTMRRRFPNGIAIVMNSIVISKSRCKKAACSSRDILLIKFLWR